MFNWLGTLIVLVSIVVLFAAWTRAVRVKEKIDMSAHGTEWALLRTLVFIAMVYQVVLAIIAIIGLKVTFAWLSAIFLIYYGVVFYFANSFFFHVAEKQSSPPQGS
ncbi:MAG: hypothetical protein AB7F31_02215 [Parachlamydiales bacterium]